MFNFINEWVHVLFIIIKNKILKSFLFFFLFYISCFSLHQKAILTASNYIYACQTPKAIIQQINQRLKAEKKDHKRGKEKNSRMNTKRKEINILYIRHFQ